MRESVGGSVVHSWRALVESGPVAGLEDGPLLERFASVGGDAAEVAFATLVARHGPMVRRVCLRVLDDSHDADDAFQATFLVLARKARAIRQPDRLANWLYGTAHRASRRLRADLARRRRHELARTTPPSSSDPGRLEEDATVLDEVAGLPDSCRVAVVLCDLEGLTQDEAARRLGCSDRTLRRRLTQAHDLLRSRLTRRGLAPSMAVLAIGSGPVPEALADATSRAAVGFASGKSTAGLVPSSSLILAEGVLKAMTWTKLKTIATVAGCLLALGGGSRLMARPQGPLTVPKSEARAVEADPIPAEQYRALVKRWDDAQKAYQAAVASTASADQREKLSLKIGSSPKDHLPSFVALAETYPEDPTAADALFWVLEWSLSGASSPDDLAGRSVSRTMEILARDHSDNPRLGALVGKLTWSHDTLKAGFLRVIAGRSRDRVVQGRANLALGLYLRSEAAQAENLQKPGRPVAIGDLLMPDMPDDLRAQTLADPAEEIRAAEEMYAKHRPDYLKALKQADFAALRREADRALDRAAVEFGDIPFVRADGLATRETLADVVRRYRMPVPDAEKKAEAEAARR